MTARDFGPQRPPISPLGAQITSLPSDLPLAPYEHEHYPL
eukprot:CAMPEP_0119126314 /NCGR_PEP_ID=MMETSP1310-20130426/5292_1 /TAXON_ID=464262 /ORGANISM="Genus nov. species nov., Strain RCC2339" /LENGTH=39 /DNA_ID= /DNA_START= /DNA_END= /DNA_ORIENTATION=